MIKQSYDDGKKHVHVLSFGGGTQSTALLLMALKGEINGVIPDYIIFSDTGWEPRSIYNWVDKVNSYIKQKYGREIIFTNGGNIREDFI
ncbi:phosphoadenosine phosphosulfate reductase family protein, partial [Metasolibacillus sp.]|uniref:phosphoadenosine phosphosulfate reductase domain-containing protein n=1 Tax=Metasolibacillus sp. TaxID=2703680 RepID=UPI0025D8D731